ncbi:hypothetical protein [Nostoc sp.]|uniref:hypothetical protein n=1 Tax=Nostoc sp. TaxID=1180 RepID=UPI002FF5515D
MSKSKSSLQNCTQLLETLRVACFPVGVRRSSGHRFRLPTSDFRLPTSDFRLPTSLMVVGII